jgi:uncharacterized damage-inducible protein DinB
MACIKLIESGTIDFTPVPAPGYEQMVAIFDQGFSELIDRVEKMDDAAFNRPAKLMSGGKLLFEQPVSFFLWLLHMDAVHHRGQLSTYLRPMGSTVPSIYGPSGDDPGN